MADNRETNGRASGFDLIERRACFGEKVIQFCLAIRFIPINSPLVSQLVRAATSRGANYSEAEEAATKKEFCYRISLCKRETKETKHGVRMVVVAEPDRKQAARELWKEANERTRIFAAIHRSAIKPPKKTPEPK